jgi:hypothetical protein
VPTISVIQVRKEAAGFAGTLDAGAVERSVLARTRQ